MPKRANQDHIYDYNGLRLLDLCQATGLLIANGRMLDDNNQGKYTYCSNNGRSTVDYLLLYLTDFKTISKFDIREFNEFSDHAALSFSLYTNNLNQNYTEEPSSINRKIVWDANKIIDFQNILTNKSDIIQEFTSELPHEPIDRVVTNFTRMLHDSAFEMFGKTYNTSGYKSHKKKSNDAWFDESCANAKTEFNAARNRFNRTRTDQSRINFVRARTRFNHIKTKAKRIFRIKEGRRIDNLASSRPKEFWKNVNSCFKKKHAASE